MAKNWLKMSKSIFKFAHLASLHSRYDTRIFIKMCSSLAANGYDISLIVADDKTLIHTYDNLIDVKWF